MLATIDLEVSTVGTITTVRSTSEAGREWLEDNAIFAPWQGDPENGIVCVPRMANDLVAGAQGDGLEVG